MNYCRAGGWVFIGIGLVLAASSCDSRDDTELTGYDELGPSAGGGAMASRCVPNQTLGCMGVCEQPLAGYQVCAADGRSYGDCICPPPSRLGPLPLGPGRDNVQGGITVLPSFEPPGVTPAGMNGNPVSRAVIGAACERDTDCGTGLDCFDGASDSLGAGGPAGGYCTKACGALADCRSVDPLSGCGTLAGQSLCLRLCQSQTPIAGEVKCLDRPELTCASLAALGNEEPTPERQIGICVPNCGSDAECGGRRCDLGSGLCTDEPEVGAPIGTACEAGADCGGGICLTASEQAGRFCSAFCTLGVPGCGFGASASSVGATCLLPQVPGEGEGDRGLCFELCDDAQDCVEPGSVCVPRPASGRAGVCARPLVPVVTPPAADPGIGAACEVDANCGEGLICLSSEGEDLAPGRGPAGGYCSLRCDPSQPCPGEGAVCAGLTREGAFCFSGCELGAEGSCGGRDTLSCGDLNGQGICQPSCNADADCGERRCDPVTRLCMDAPECEEDADCDEQVCDLLSGTCVDAPAGCTTDADCEAGACDVLTGLCTGAQACSLDTDCGEQVCDTLADTCIDAPPAPIGGACVENTECGAGACVALFGSPICTAPCTLGTSAGCEFYGSDAFCLLPIDQAAGLGACIELCSVPADCEQAGDECFETGPIHGRTGVCLPP